MLTGNWVSELSMSLGRDRDRRAPVSGSTRDDTLLVNELTNRLIAKLPAASTRRVDLFKEHAGAAFL